MKLRKSLSIVIVALFLIVGVFSFIGLFSVKKINATFAVSDDTDIALLQSKFDEFLGENIFFLKEEEIVGALDEFHYMEIVSLDKQFPNVVNVKVEKRREVYYLDYGTNYLVMTAEGFILRSVSKNLELTEDRDKIVLVLDGVSILDATIGETVKTDKDTLIHKVFDMAKSVSLTDCIKKITVFSRGSELSDVTFSTYTGVDIVVEKVEESGVDKVVEGFKAYDMHASDYEKMFKTIRVYKSEQEKIQVVWSDKV